MRVDDLENGSYYTIRGAENITLTAWQNGEQWWLEDDTSGVTYELRGDALIECDFMGNELIQTSWTLDDIVPDNPEATALGLRIDAHIDEVARELLDDVDIF